MRKKRDEQRTVEKSVGESKNRTRRKFSPEVKGTVMSDQEAFERILASLYDAMLDDTHWPATSALIDEACGLTGNALLVGEGPKDDIRVLSVGLYSRGQRQEELEREYLEVYHPIDERVPRIRQLPDSRLVHVTDLYTAEELKTSPTYNEILLRAKCQNGLIVRLDGPDSSHMTWSFGDPVASDGWGSSEIAMIKKLMPHIRQFIRVRQTLVRAETRNTTVTALLDNPRIGVLHLDRRGRIMEVNDRARSILRQGDGLSDRDGVLRAREAADRLRLERLVASALPASGAVAVSGSMLLGRSSGLPPLVVHVKPVAVPTTGLRSAARRRSDPDYRAEESASDRPRPGGQDPGADADGEPGSGLVGGRQERPRHGRGHGAHPRLHLLATEADLPETADLPAGRSGAAGAVDHRVRITAALPACSEGGAVAGRFLIFPNLQIWQGPGGVEALDLLQPLTTARNGRRRFR